jgi:hypothetical protein
MIPGSTFLEHIMIINDQLQCTRKQGTINSTVTVTNVTDGDVTTNSEQHFHSILFRSVSRYIEARPNMSVFPIFQTRCFHTGNNTK